MLLHKNKSFISHKSNVRGSTNSLSSMDVLGAILKALSSSWNTSLLNWTPGGRWPVCRTGCWAIRYKMAMLNWLLGNSNVKCICENEKERKSKLLYSTQIFTLTKTKRGSTSQCPIERERTKNELQALTLTCLTILCPIQKLWEKEKTNCM